MVGDEREVPAQFDHAGQLAPVLAGLADRKDGCFIDGEHGRSLDPSAWQEQADARRRRAKRDVHRLTDVTTDTKLKTCAIVFLSRAPSAARLYTRPCRTAPSQSHHYGKFWAVAGKSRGSPGVGAVAGRCGDLAGGSIQSQPEAAGRARGLAGIVAQST